MKTTGNGLWITHTHEAHFTRTLYNSPQTAMLLDRSNEIKKRNFTRTKSDLFLIPSPPLSLSLSLILAIDTPPVFTRSLSLSLSFSSPTVPQYFQDLPCESEKLRHRAPYTCIHGNPQKQNGGCLRNCGQVFTCYFQRPLPGDENLVCVMIPPVKQLLLIAGGPQVHRQWTDGARR